MAELIVDPDRFQLCAALIDWLALARRDPSQVMAVERSRRRRVVQLRWLLDPTLGYPTRPFEVYQRPALNVTIEKALPVDDANLLLHTLFGWSAYLTPAPMVYVRASVYVDAAQSNVLAFAGAPFGSTLVGIQTVTSGWQDVSFSAPHIGSVVIFDGAEMNNWVGIDGASACAGNWTLLERVALPVDQADWADVLELDGMQGPVAAPLPPIDAALDRFARGAAPFGWLSSLQPGIAAPPWKQADPKAFLQSMREDVLGDLKQMLTTLPPDQQSTLQRSVLLNAIGGDPASATYSVLGSLLFAAGSDPVASLLAGFGTAVDEVDIPPVSVRDHAYFNDPSRSDYDYMVTATYRGGADGRSEPLTYAALALSPKVGLPPPAPANLAASCFAMQSPPVLDAAWHAVIGLQWDRLPPGLPVRMASYCHARADGGSSTSSALIGKRKHDAALQPIGISSVTDDPATLPYVRASDSGFALPGVPAVVPLHYGVAHQDIFGLWSAWSATGINVEEPPVGPVVILRSALEPQAAMGVCPAVLTIEFSWDWSARTPTTIRFVGGMYPQAWRGQPPAVTTTPTGMQRSFAGGPGSPFAVHFDPDGTATADAGGVVQYLSEDGSSFLSGPATNPGPRRYRLSITDVQLDFGVSPHIGMLLSGMATERRPPGRSGTWGVPPTIVSASDPRPPEIVVEHEDVLLASMADAAGEHHALLAWPAAAGAAGYFIYTAAESKLRRDYGLDEASLQRSLSDRLLELRDAFAANPARRYFTRLNQTPFGETSYQATLPRGSKDIHFFLVVGVSAGGVESAWPDASDALRRKRPIAYAAPQRVVPSAPTLEAVRRADPDIGPDAFRADLRIVTSPGAVVDRIDIYRVAIDQAALSLDTMGPPVFTVRAGDAGWTIVPTPANGTRAAQPLGTLAGSDRPAGSWKRQYYCAAAWSVAVPEKGIVGGRSQPSAVRSVIIPPDGPPDLAPLSRDASSGLVVDVSTTTSVPIEATLLGAHRLRAEVFASDAGAALVPLLSWPAVLEGANRPDDSSLGALPVAAPATGVAGIWREIAGAATKLRLRVIRSSLNTTLKIRLQLDDPLGRSTERVLDVLPDPTPAALAFGAVAVRRVVGKGFIVSVPVNLPLAVPAIAGYRLQALYRPRIRGRGFPIPPRLGNVIDVDYAAIPQPRVFEDPFANTVRLPVRRQALDATHTTLRFYLRGAGGVLTTTLSAADGTKATFTQQVP